MTWQDIIGHDKIIRRLRSMLAAGRLPHALLFTGERGIGKYLVARTLSAALLCGEQDEHQEPCGRCESCRRLALGDHPDFLEIRPEDGGKAAKNIKIEQIREMQTAASRLPVISPRRVIIIDEAETMNEAASNSLLKILEEPGAGTVFILVSASREALLPTILSRTMPVAFGTLPIGAVQSELARRGVAAASDIAPLSGGSLGRALELAETGQSRRDEALDFLEKLPQLDMWTALERGQNIENLLRAEKMTRTDVSAWLYDFMLLLRDVLVLEALGGEELLYNRARRESLSKIASRVDMPCLLSLLSLVRETARRLTANVNIPLLMTGFFIRLSDMYYET